MQLTGAQIIIECLKEQRTQTLFGYPGGTVLSVYDALRERGDGIRHILTTHEQGAAHAADGYARATGRTGVCLVTSGPGATNLVTGIATAYMDSSPVVAITINVPVGSLGRDSFQEIDIAGITMPVTKHNFIVKDISQLADVIRRAFRVASSGRKGPVLVDIARDVTENVFEYEPVTPPERTVPEFPGFTSAVGRIATAFLHARRPVIVAGGGCIGSGAGGSLSEFAGAFGIPVVDTMMGRGAIAGSSPLSLGMGGEYGTEAAARAMSECDLMVAVGCRFSDRLTGENCELLGKCKLVHVDIDKAELNKNVCADIALQADADRFFKAILVTLEKRSQGRNVDYSGWLKYLSAFKNTDTFAGLKGDPDKALTDSRGLSYNVLAGSRGLSDDTPLTGDIVAKVAGEEAGSEAIFVTEVGECQISAVKAISYERPGSLITSGGLGTMGFGLGAAIGAKAGCPGRKVINFAGDGSFRMNMAEIMTAVTNELPVIEIVFDNGILGMVHTMQKERFGGRYVATELDDTFDYAGLARAMKARAHDCRDVKELRAALREALKDKKPDVHVIVCHLT